MKNKKSLAIILLGLSFCFVPALGYGEVKQWMIEQKTSYIDVLLLEAMVVIIMVNPTKFGDVRLLYDWSGSYGKELKFPAGIDTKGKILVRVTDSRDRMFSKSGTNLLLLEQFKQNLNNLYTYIEDIATDMDSDIVAKFYSKGDIPLGYFYQGEYHLWEK